MQKRLLHEIQHIRLYLVLTAAIAALMRVMAVVQAAAITQIIDGVFLARQELPSVVSVLLILSVAIAARALLIWGRTTSKGNAAASWRRQ